MFLVLHLIDRAGFGKNARLVDVIDDLLATDLSVELHFVAQDYRERRGVNIEFL